MTIIIIRIY